MGVVVVRKKKGCGSATKGRLATNASTDKADDAGNEDHGPARANIL